VLTWVGEDYRASCLWREELDADRACGCQPIRGLLCVAKERGLRCQAVNSRNSGDTSVGCGRVVGYGAFVFMEN